MIHRGSRLETPLMICYTMLSKSLFKDCRHSLHYNVLLLSSVTVVLRFWSTTLRKKSSMLSQQNIRTKNL